MEDQACFMRAWAVAPDSQEVKTGGDNSVNKNIICCTVLPGPKGEGRKIYEYYAQVEHNEAHPKSHVYPTTNYVHWSAGAAGRMKFCLIVVH